LEAVTSFASDLGADVQEQGEAYADFVAITDDTGAIQVEVPASWSDVDGRPWEMDNGATFASVYASPSLEDFENSWGTPGVYFNVTAQKDRVGGHVPLLDQLSARDGIQACTLDGRHDYDDGVYRGYYDYFVDCGPEGAHYLILSAVPIEAPEAALIWVEIGIASDADLDAADRILETFQVVGALP
jgi:serine protease Do